MLAHTLWILTLLGLIVLVCALFTNSIEWLGHRFKLSEGAVGSVLAAVGTALPETLVPIVALFSSAVTGSGIPQAESHEIGIGAILGAPFLLSTLALFVSGLAVLVFARLGKRGVAMHPDVHLSKRDFLYFFPPFILVVGLGLIPTEDLGLGWLKTIIAFGLLAYYGFYVWRTLAKEHVADTEFDFDPLWFSPKRLEPETFTIIAQVAFSLVFLLILAHLFVAEIRDVAHLLRVNPLILSLIIVPIATELPEKFNSVLWIARGKDSMALGNITGAKVFQSCIPTSIGLLFTPWLLSFDALLSAGLCLCSSGLIFTLAFKNVEKTAYYLLLGGLFYLIFLVFALTQLMSVPR